MCEIVVFFTLNSSVNGDVPAASFYNLLVDSYDPVWHLTVFCDAP